MENNRDERLHDVVSRAFLWEGLPSIAVHEWGRDCDQFESTNAFLLSIDLPPSNGGGMNKGCSTGLRNCSSSTSSVNYQWKIIKKARVLCT